MTPPKKTKLAANARKRAVPGAATTKGRDPAAALRRRIFESLPAATWSQVRQVDAGVALDPLLAAFGNGSVAGVDSRGAARAMQRACHEDGLRAWCLEIGDPATFTHTVVLVEQQSKLRLHDPYLDLSSPRDFADLIADLRAERMPALEGGQALRPYIADPAQEDDIARAWLGLPAGAQRGTRVMVRGGEDMLAGTSPAYRALQAGLRAEGRPAGLAALLDSAISLIAPLDDASDDYGLSDLLGLHMPATTITSTRDDAGAAPALRPAASISQSRDSASALAQEQIGLVLNQMIAERGQLVESLTTLQARHSELFGALTEANARAAGLERAETDLRAQLDRAVSARDALQRGNDERLIQVEQLHRERERSQRANDDSAAEIARLAAGIDDLVAARRAAELEAQRAEERLRQMKAEVDDAVADTQRLAAALAKAEAEKDTLRTDSSRYRSEAARQAAQIAISQAEAERTVARSADQDTRLRRLEEEAAGEIAQLAAALGDAETREQEASRKAAELAADRERLQAELATVTGESAEWRRQAASHRAETMSATSETHRLRNSIEDLTGELDRLATEQDIRHGEMVQLIDAAERLRKDVNDLEVERGKDREKADAAVRELEKARSAEQARAEESLCELERSRAAAESLEVSVATLETERAQLASALLETESALRQQLALVKSRDEEIAHREARARAEKQAQLEAERERERRATVHLLPSIIAGDAASVHGDGTLASKSWKGGCLCYGPYLHLEPGAFTLELEFERSPLGAAFASKFITEIVDGQRYLCTRQFRLGAGRQRIAIDFEVPPTTTTRRVEFRLLIGRRAMVTLLDMQLRRSDLA